MERAFNIRLRTRSLFVADIDGTCGVVTDKNRGQMRFDSRFFSERLGFVRDLFPSLRCNGFAVDDGCGHGRFLSTQSSMVKLGKKSASP